MKKKEDIVIKSKEEAFWIDVKKNTKLTIEAFENKLKFERAVLEMCKIHLKKAELLEKRKHAH